MKSCKLTKEQYLEEVSFNYDKRFQLDARFQDLEKRKRHPAAYLAKETKEKFHLEEDADLEEL